MGRVLTTKFGQWVDTRSSTDNTLHGSGRAVEKSGILLQIEKVAEGSDGDLTCHVFSLEDAVAHLAVSNSSGILTIEKYFYSPLRLQNFFAHAETVCEVKCAYAVFALPLTQSLGDIRSLIHFL